jgi:ketosteroid isomerase-like protein
MSQEDVEVVRSLFAAWGSGGLEATAEFWHPQVDWRAAEGALDDVGEIRGQEAMRAYVQDWLEDFDDLTFELEEVIDAGQDVVTVQWIRGRAKGSGVATELRFAVVYTISDGRIVRGREYWTKDEALEAASRSE